MHPMVTACFNQNGDIYISAYHRIDRKQCNFLYSWTEKKVISEVKSIQLEKVSVSNFPVKSFYSEVKREIYTFYRQGWCVEQGLDFENDELLPS
jgi:hypothetical protein